MKTYACLCLMLLISCSAFAGTVSRRIGRFDYYTDSKGKTYVGNWIGDTYYINSPNGNVTACNQIGNATYCN